MKRNSRIRRQREAAQKRIAFLFCSLIAVVMIGSIIFGTIHTQAAPAETTYKYYTSVQIESGDTLWAIASEYITDEYTDMNEYMEEVCAINHISEDEIHAGQYIVVPYYAAETAN
ncbi:MAG: LysM peptidoglycan-binding domain-containing protein [Roseburia sp.]|nr:LysM peptidoglycan-binding domain-containing protein [Roseburia sp.]